MSMITLASSSPRRKDLLEKLFKEIEIVYPDVDESILEFESAPNMVLRLSKMKATSIKRDNIVIGADTTVEIEGKILGKPKDEFEAYEMLKLLSGKWHTVHTGICATLKDKIINFVESTRVKFYVLDDETINNYIKTGSPMDKAGAYGIQEDLGMILVERIEGDFFTIIGLPVSRLWWEMKENHFI